MSPQQPTPRRPGGAPLPALSVPDAAGRVARVHAFIAAEPELDSGAGLLGWLRKLCGATARALPASGAGVSVMTDQGVRGTAAASDVACEELEDLQFTFGEGPCIDAFNARGPVLEPDLGAAGSRWPGYAPAAHAMGARAVFAFPLQVGAGRLGVLDVYRDTVGVLSPPQVDLATTFADVALMTLLDGQAEAPKAAGHDALEGVLAPRLEIYQAQGMVSVQLGVSLAEAMARLRAHAYAQDRPLVIVASDVIARRLVLDRDDV